MKNNLFILGTLLISGISYAGEFMTLKYNEVNMRTGPGERFPIIWVYQEKNFPVEVLDSFELWRQVREQDGTIGWIHQNMLTKNRYVVVKTEHPMIKTDTPDSSVVATIQQGVIAHLESCKDYKFCRITVNYRDKKYSGYFPRQYLWGIDADELID